jgi:hypothetical protein
LVEYFFWKVLYYFILRDKIILKVKVHNPYKVFKNLID